MVREMVREMVRKYLRNITVLRVNKQSIWA